MLSISFMTRNLGIAVLFGYSRRRHLFFALPRHRNLETACYSFRFRSLPDAKICSSSQKPHESSGSLSVENGLNQEGMALPDERLIRKYRFVSESFVCARSLTS